MNAGPLTILVVDDNRSRASVIEAGLRQAGYDRVVVEDSNEVARAVEALRPDVVVIDLETPSHDRLAQFFALSRALERPIAMFVDRSDAAEIEAAVAAGVSAYVVDGLRQERMRAVLEVAISRFNALARLQSELRQVRGELEDRTIIEQAKQILMGTRGMGEPEAHALLRKTAMNQNRRMAEIARSLVTAAGLLAPEDD